MTPRPATRHGAGDAVLHSVPDRTHRLEHRTIHGYRRAYRTAGSGPAIVLVHGIGDSSAAWADVIDLLAQHHTVIAPDLLGHGQSDKPRADYSVAAYANGLRDLLSALDIRRATVVGHSLGGGVAMQFCYQFPEFVERLVLVSTGGVTRDVSPVLRMLALPGVNAAIAALRIPGVLPAAHSMGRTSARVAAVRRERGAPLPLPSAVRSHLHDAPELMRIVDGLAEVTAHAAFTRTLRAVVDWRGQVVTMLDRAYLTERLPVLLVWGTRDTIIPYAHARLAHSAMPLSVLETFEDAGHFPHHDDPTRFVSAVRAFVASTTPMTHDVEEWARLLRRGPLRDALNGSPSEQKAVLEVLAHERNAT